MKRPWQNRRSALCPKHVIPRYHTVVELDWMLLPIWKLFHYSSIKQIIFEQAQAIAEVRPIKIIKACTTRWLTHDEATSHVISRFEPILDALETVVETLRNREEVSRNDGELGKIFSTHVQEGILQAFTLQKVRSWLKMHMFHVVVGNKEKCLAKQGNKLSFQNFQLVVVNQQYFGRFYPFRIKRNINENKNLRVAAAAL